MIIYGTMKLSEMTPLKWYQFKKYVKCTVIGGGSYYTYPLMQYCRFQEEGSKGIRILAVIIITVFFLFERVFYSIALLLHPPSSPLSLFLWQKDETVYHSARTGGHGPCVLMRLGIGIKALISPQKHNSLAAMMDSNGMLQWSDTKSF